MIKIRLNPDSKTAKDIKDSVILNDGYCPCRIQKTEDTKCMCKDFRESTELGLCHCGLYERYDDGN